MSSVICVYDFIDIGCPTCGEMMKIDDIDVSMTIEHYDMASIIDECAFEIKCTDCGKQIKIVPELHIGVSHP